MAADTLALGVDAFFFGLVGFEDGAYESLHRGGEFGDTSPSE